MRRWQRLLRRRELETELDKELRFHLAERQSELEHAGLTAAAARRQARLEFGTMDSAKEQCRDVRGTQWVEAAIQDTRYALRVLRAAPSFTAMALLTLALGTGAVTTMYSVVHSVLLNPFPYTDPRRMVDVVVQDLDRPRNGIRGGLTVAEFRTFVDESNVFESAAGAMLTSMLYRSDAGVERFEVAALTPNSFRFLGVPPLQGRTFAEEDTQPGVPAVAVLSHKAWQTYFGGDPAVLGRTIFLDQRPRTVVGVMPPRFTWHVADVWIPDAAERGDPEGGKKGFWLQARLKQGVSLTDAEAALNVLGARLARLYPERYPKRWHVQVITVIDWVVGRFRGVLYTLFAAVGLLLLIACSNVASLLLARATVRQRELSVRTALGATRTRIICQLMVESVLLALGGGVLGVLLAYAGTWALRPLIPPYTIPVETEITITPAVLLFSLAVVAITVLLFGVVPALGATRRDLAPGLASSGKGADSGTSHSRLRTALVVAQVTLSLVLLTGAAALMRNFLSLLQVDLGFAPQQLVVAHAATPRGTPAEKRQFLETALRRVAGVPGVVSAALITGVPPYGGFTTEVQVSGQVGSTPMAGQVQLCSESYFETIGLHFLGGSAFTRHDVATARKVAVVNQTFVRQYLPMGNPMGQQIRLVRLESTPFAVNEPAFEVVGVVRDVRNRGLEEPSLPEAFVPFTVAAIDSSRVLVRTASDPGLMTNAIRRELMATNPNVAQRQPLLLQDVVRDQSYARPRFSVVLMALFAGIGFALVGTGVYGVMAYMVSRRRREIGIRLALGAERGQVFRSVLMGALRLIGVGILPGGLGSLAANRAIASQVWTVAAFEPVALLTATVLIALLGAIAALRPALRAMRMDPMSVLRQE